jgi:REP element-mobilizing transposase RayT
MRTATFPDGFFHVVSRAVFGQRIYVDNVDRRCFLRLLEDSERKTRWRCLAYCLMTTHYHLVIAGRTRQLSTGMQLLNGRYALGFNRRHERFGALFAERYSVTVVESEEHLFDACAYVVLNPVKAHLCDRADQWPWSYSAYGLEAA